MMDAILEHGRGQRPFDVSEEEPSSTYYTIKITFFCFVITISSLLMGIRQFITIVGLVRWTSIPETGVRIPGSA